MNRPRRNNDPELMRYLVTLMASAAAAWLAQPLLTPPPVTIEPTLSTQTPRNTEIAATCTATNALVTLDRVAVASPPALPHASSPAIVLQMTGAPMHELSGIATVIRSDGTTVDVPFSAGQLTIAARGTLNGVRLCVPGFAVVWPTVRTPREQIEVPMQRAGSIRVRLTDSSGAPLADREIWCQCQRADVARPGNYQGNARAVTDQTGITTLQSLVPGTFDVGTCRVGEWDAVRCDGVTVAADCLATLDLVAPLLPPTQYGGFHLPLPADGTVARGSNNSVTNLAFATASGCYEIHVIGEQLRCVARGRQGDVIVGRIVAFDDQGVRADLRRSAPISITIGALLSWHPTWER